MTLEYNDEGYRTTKLGHKSHKKADENLLHNLRFRWSEELKEISDESLLDSYDEFALSEEFGDNDARFLEFIGIDESDIQR